MSIFEYNQEQHFRQIAEENQAVGWEKGREEGREIATLTALGSLVETLALTVEQAMAALKIPEDERNEYRDKMNR